MGFPNAGASRNDTAPVCSLAASTDLANFAASGLPNFDSATGMSLQIAKAAQDLCENQRRHLSSRGRLLEMRDAPPVQGGFDDGVRELQGEGGDRIREALEEMRGQLLEIEAEVSSNAAEVDWLVDVDQRMEALLQKVDLKLGDFERIVGHS